MTAQDFNEAGMFFYNRRLWYEAEIMFYVAMELDARHILARYNFARVLSIRINNSIPRHQYLENIFFHNSAPFDVLAESVRLDPNSAIKARNEPDFHNIRVIDTRLFDAITLPENQRERFEHNLVYIDLVFSPGIGVFDLIFAEIGHEHNNQRWIRISPWFSPLLSEANLYYSDYSDEDFPRWVRNEEMIGKIFRMVIIDHPFHIEGIGGSNIGRTNRVFYINEL